MKQRAKIDQELCTHVRILLAGGATGEQAAKITNTNTGTVSRIKSAGFDYPTFLANTQTRRIEEQNKRADEKICEALNKLRETQTIPGQIRMEIPEQKPEMSEQTKMMRFQAAQVEKLAEKLDKLNDTLNQILRAIRKE